MSTSSAVLYSFVLAVIPALLYTLLVWWLDRHEREPGRLILIMFVWGAAPAVVMSILLELALGQSLTSLEPGLWQGIRTAADSLAAPVIEEVAKGVALLALCLVASSEFDNVLDGIVYGAVIGFGFAMTENFLYFLEAAGPDQGQRWTSLVLLRSLLFGLNHAFYTAIIGAGLGLAVEMRRQLPRGRWLFPLVGLGLAIAFHAVHNLGIALAGKSALALWIAILADWGGVLLLLIIVILALQQEQQWIATELYSEVGKTLSPSEYVAASSYGRRLVIWLQILSQHGWRAARRSSQHHYLLAELAFLKRQLRRSGNSPRLQRQVEEVRARLLRLGPGRA